jgi:hypothetical protein
MILIILIGILSGGIIPLLSLIGFGVELIISIFKPVSWGYWQQAAVGMVFSALTSMNLIKIYQKEKK